MSLRLRLVVLTTAGLIAAGFTASLLVDPLCSIFRSKRHYAHRTESHTSVTVSTTSPAATTTPTSLAEHR